GAKGTGAEEPEEFTARSGHGASPDEGHREMRQCRRRDDIRDEKARKQILRPRIRCADASLRTTWRGTAFSPSRLLAFSHSRLDLEVGWRADAEPLSAEERALRGMQELARRVNGVERDRGGEVADVGDPSAGARHRVI